MTDKPSKTNKENKEIRILNLYAGIGGNRKLWKNCKVTAIENNKGIADIYSNFFPSDTVLIEDAHEYLLKHYKEFDFIWSSPPCPTHSDIRRCGVHKGQYEAMYPEMGLYQEIILLKHFAKGYWVVENVKPYYEPLIAPDFIINRHYFWGNVPLGNSMFENTQKIEIPDSRVHNDIKGSSTVYGFNLNAFELKDYSGGKRKVLRNLVNPEVGKYILERVTNAKH